MKDLEIRHPNIQYLISIAQKYSHLTDQYKSTFEEIVKHWQDLTVKTLDTTQKAKINLFTDEQLTKYLEDNFRMYNITVYCAWALGREYAQTSPQQAKYYLLIEDINSDNLLASTKNELLDLADYAIQFLLHNLLVLYKSNAISESDFVIGVEKAKGIFRLGTLWAFQNGIASLHKQP
jgi:hypothetical protein